jgi:hypothetical protein
MNEIVLAGTKHQISFDPFQIRRTDVLLKIPCQKQSMSAGSSPKKKRK